MAGTNKYDSLISNGVLGDDDQQEDKYTSLINNVENNKTSDLMISMQQASRVDPDAHTDAVKISEATNLPLETVERNQQEAKSKMIYEENDYLRLINESPVVSDFLSDPANSKVVRDDIANLTGLEWMFGAARTVQVESREQLDIGHLGFALMLDSENEDLIAEIERMNESQNQYFGEQGWLEGAWVEANRMIPQIFNALESGAEGGLVGANIFAGGALVAGQLGPQVLAPEEVVTVPTAAATGFYLGSRTGAAQAAFFQEAGHAYLEFREMTDVNGVPLDDDVARFAALASGTVNALLETVGLETLVKTVPGGDKLTQKLTRGQIKETLKNPAVQQALKDFATKYGTALSVETATEISQELVVVLLGELAKEVDGGEFDNISGDEVADRISEVGEKTAQGMTILAGLGPGVRLSGDLQRVQKAKRNQVLLELMSQNANDSKTLQRMPDKYQELISNIKESGDNAIKNVYIPGDKFVEYFQSQGIDLEEMAGAIPNLQEQLRQSAATGSDIIIPIDQYMVNIAPTDHHQGLFNDIRFDPDDMTLRESQEFQQSSVDRIEEMIQEGQDLLSQQEEINVSTQSIQTDVKEQLMQAGRTEDVADREALIFSSFFQTMGERSGKDPFDLFKERDIVITSETLNQREQHVQSVMRKARASGYEGDSVVGAIEWEIALNKELDMSEEARRLRATEMGADFDANPDLAYDPEFQQQIADTELAETTEGAQEDAAGVDISSTEQDNLGVDIEEIEANDRNETIRTDDRTDEGQTFNQQPTVAEVQESATDATVAQRDIEADTDRERTGAEGLDIDDRIVEDLPLPEVTELTFDEAFAASIDEDQLTENQIREAALLWQAQGVQSPFFKRWFGDSKMTNEAGDPIVFYHGTDAVITEFDRDLAGENTELATSGLGIFFTPKIGTAEIHGENVLAGYVKMENPFIMPIAENPGFATVEEARAFSEELERQGYDGIYVPESDFAIIFNSEQFKLRDNRGTFDPDDPRILFQRDVPSDQIEQQEDITINEEHKNAFQQFSERISSMFGQKDQEGGKGSIRLTNSEAVITLMENADLSTVGHEMGHLFLDIFKGIAEDPNSQQSIKDDWSAIQNWWKENADSIAKEATPFLDKGKVTAEQVNQFVDNGTTNNKEIDSAINSATHEQWARAFEAYLFTGKAPSISLQSAFQRFKAWMISIYKNIKNLGVNLTPELTEVFDRMLATDAEIDVLEQQQKLYEPILKNIEGIFTEEQRTQYIEQSQQAIEEAKENLLQDALKEVSREQKNWWKEERQKTMEKVTNEVNDIPVYQAIHWLQTGETLNGLASPAQHQKMSKQIIVDQYGQDVLDALPKPLVYQEDGGLHPDVIAGLFGVESGGELLTQMTESPSRDAAIQNRTDTLMEEKFGNILDDGTLEERAKRNLRSESAADLLLQELKILARTNNIPVPSTSVSRQVLKAAAQEIIAKQLVKDIKPNVHSNAEIREAKAAQNAIANEDFRSAAFHRRRQLLSHYLYRESLNAQEETKKIIALTRRLQKKPARQRIGKAGGDFLDQIDALMERFNFKTNVSLKEIEKRKSLAQFISEQEAVGNEVIIDDKIKNEAMQIHYKELPMEQLRGISDTLKNIEHLSRLKNKLLNKKEKRDFDKVVSDLVSSIDENNTKIKETTDYSPDLKGRIKQGLNKLHAEHTKMEFLFRKLDGWDALGESWNTLFEPFVDAQDAEQLMMQDIAEKYNNIFSEYTRIEMARWRVTKIFVPEISKSFTKNEILAMAMNWGNQENRSALAEGLGVKESDIEFALVNLDDRDWRMVQNMWDLINEFWPQISELQKELTGIAPKQVEAMAFIAPNGQEMKGGYYPLKYDPARSWLAQKRLEKESTQDIFENNWLRPQTKQGHTKERVGSGGQAVLLDLNVATEHLTQVAHDLTHRKAIIDVDKIVSQDDVRKAIESTAGKEMYAQLRPWLQAIANDRRVPDNSYDKIISRARVGATIVNMGWKITTAIVQPLGLFQTVDVIGVKSTWNGLMRFTGNGNPLKMKEQVDFVLERSVMMRNRMNSYNREVRDTLKRTELDGLKHQIDQSFFFLTGMMDMSVAVPSWLGAYQKAMDGNVDNLKLGDEEAAIQYADSVVRISQSAGTVKDLAKIQRGSETWRLFTMFYSYFSVLYNLGSERIAQVNANQLSFPQIAASAFFLWFGPAVLSELIADRGPEDDEEWEAWLAENIIKYPFQSIIILRDMVNHGINQAAGNPFDFSLTPAAEAFAVPGEAVAGIVTDLAKEGEISRQSIEKSVLAASYWGHLPGRQTWITTEYLYDYATDTETADNPFEFIREAAFGGDER